MSLAELRQKRAETVAKAEQINDTAVKESRDLSETENASYQAHIAAIKSYDANIQRLENLGVLKAAGGGVKEVPPPPGSFGADENPLSQAEKSGNFYYAEPKGSETAEQKADVVGGMLKALAQTKGQVGEALRLLEAKGDDPAAQRVAKALNSGTASAGAYTVPTDLAVGVIELLTPRSVVRRAGPSPLILTHGNMTLPRLSGGASGYYIGEGTDIPVSQPTFDSITLSGKKCVAMVPISNDLLRRGQSGVDTIVRNDMLRALATTSDLAFLRSVGSATSPKGLISWAAAGNVVAANATVNLQNVTNDLAKLEQALAVNNVTEEGRCWFMNPRSMLFLKNLRDGNGNLVYNAELSQGRLNGYPVYTTTLLPTNLGAGSNQSEIIFAAMPDVILAEEQTLMFALSTESSYTVGGVKVSSFERDETLMRAIMLHDLGVRHEQSVAVLTGVTWSV